MPTIQKIKLSDYGRIINDAYHQVLCDEMHSNLDGKDYTRVDFDRFILDKKKINDSAIIEGHADTLSDLCNITFTKTFPLLFVEFAQTLEQHIDNYCIVLHHPYTNSMAAIFDFKEDFVFQVVDTNSHLIIERTIWDVKNQRDDIYMILENLLATGFIITDVDADMNNWLMDDYDSIRIYRLLLTALRTIREDKGYAKI